MEAEGLLDLVALKFFLYYSLYLFTIPRKNQGLNLQPHSYPALNGAFPNPLKLK